MKVITAPTYYEPYDNSISVFLAGGITNCPNWQDDVIDGLKDKDGDTLVIYNPRREHFDITNMSASKQQIEWEFYMIEKCNIFSMYFASSESDQPICMYELGRNILRMQMRYPTDWQERIIISVEDGYKRKQDVLIQTELATNNKVNINNCFSPENCLSNHITNIYNTFKRFR